MSSDTRQLIEGVSLFAILISSSFRRLFFFFFFVRVIRARDRERLFRRRRCAEYIVNSVWKFYQSLLFGTPILYWKKNKKNVDKLTP